MVDKPSGCTSHDVVARVRRLAGTRRVGHAGTLDPMATGVLVLGLGYGTKLLTYLVGADKTYDATVRLGVTTLTDDAEGEVLAAHDTSGVEPARLSEELARLTGPIRQRPSSISAIKVDGRRSYARVRAGEQVALAERPVTVHRLELLARRTVREAGLTLTDLDLRAQVSSGTYVRALARDLGVALGVGGHLTVLRRTSVGGFGLAQARTLEELESDFDYVPLADAARAAFPVRALTEAEVSTLRFGQRLSSTGPDADVVAGLGPEGQLVALLHEAGGQARSLFVIPA